MLLPAICANPACGGVWFAAYPFDGGGPVTIYNCALGSCPGCGRIGRVPDGVYLPVGAKLVSPSDLRIIRTALWDLQAIAAGGAPAVEIDDAIARKHPRLGPLRKCLPKGSRDLNNYLQTLILVAGLLLNTRSRQRGSTVTFEQHNYFIQEELKDVLEKPPPTPPSKKQHAERAAVTAFDTFPRPARARSPARRLLRDLRTVGRA